MKITETRNHDNREEDLSGMGEHATTRMDVTADEELHRDAVRAWMEFCLPGVPGDSPEEDDRPYPPSHDFISERLENVTQKEIDRAKQITDELNARRRLFARQGTVVATCREYKGKQLGPYYRLAYREDGCQKSIYLGTSAWVAEQVREWLATLQTPLRDNRRLQHARKMIRASLRAHQSRAKSLFARHGVHVKGFEYRGLIRRVKRMQNAECRMMNDE